MQEHEFKLEELLREQITDQELKELLRRLGEEEFGGPILSTIGDVVEATGKEPADIGRILAEIRKEAFEERYGIELESHKHRIEHLEDVTEEIRSHPISQDIQVPESLRSMSEAEVEIMTELVEREQARRDARPQAIAYVIIILAIFIFLAIYASFHPNRPAQPKPVITETWDPNKGEFVPSVRRPMESNH